MRTAALVTLLALGCPAHADDWDLTAEDKIAHMSVSYGITLTVAVVARHYEMERWKAVLLGAATALAIGTSKELFHDDHFTWSEETANVIGTASAVGIVLAFRL